MAVQGERLEAVAHVVSALGATAPAGTTHASPAPVRVGTVPVDGALQSVATLAEVKAAYEANAAARTHRASLTKLGADTRSSLSITWPGGTSGSLLFGRFVTPPLAALTTIGAGAFGLVEMLMRVREANSADNVYSNVAMWIAEPVIAPARSEHRNATAKASSSGRG